MKGWRIFAAGAALLSSPAAPAWSAPVLLISIDGLRPADVLEARKKGLKLPNLQRFADEGSWARGVKGVLPTITYPSHTTLITGAAPARHGVYANTTFDPLQINQGGWYWYGSDIQSETLWEAAAKAGLSTANVHWPVSVGVKAIQWNLPQIWRTGHEDDAKLVTALSTPGLIKELESDGSHYAPGIDETVEADENRAQFVVKLIAAHRPEFLTVYLTALDHEQHVAGPDSPTSRAVLERLDALVGKLVAAEQAARPEAIIAVASDHGFAAIDTEVNLFRAFIDAGLITLDPQGKVASWRAMPWPSGGSCAIVLADPKDAAIEAQVSDVLAGLKAKPELKIDRVLDKAAIKSWGGNPQASFYVGFKLGATAGNFKGASAALVAPSTYRGTHGYLPDEPSMRSTFMLMGPGIMPAHDLGVVDMRMIAPTLASLMGARLPSAELPALDVEVRP
ncbi:MAG: alkaline phosphatase family protein [Chakrabartia sp.]